MPGEKAWNTEAPVEFIPPETIMLQHGGQAKRDQTKSGQ